MKRPPALATVFALGLSLAACAGAQRPAGPRAALQTVTEVNGATIHDARRDLDEAAADTPARRALRDQVARYLAARGVEALQTGDSTLAIQRLRDALLHFSAEELDRGPLPDELTALARGLLASASAGGDEAHALAAARVLLSVRTPDAAARRDWERIREWGERNRREFQRPWVAEGELAEVFKEIARVVPARDVIEQAARHLVARRRAALEGRDRFTARDQPRLNFDEARQLQAGMRTAAIDLALVFLRVGDVREASNRLTELGSGNESSGLAAGLGAIAQGEGGADALWELARRLSEADPSAYAGVCRRGRRDYPEDIRFALGLAIAAARERDHGLASAHFERAAGMREADQTVLRDALEAAFGSLRREVGGDDLGPGRREYDRTRSLLARWRTQYPAQLPPVTEAELEAAAADLELSAGNLREAQGHLQRATEAEPASREAHYLLAEIAWRHRDGAEAARRLRAGLALPLRPSESDSFFRPQFAVRLGLAARVAGQAEESQRTLTEALGALDALARATSEGQLAQVHLQRAVVADALGDAEAARAALRAALDADPDSQEVAARAVCTSLARGRWADARDFYRRARAGLTLDRNWQAYFALWGVIAARVGHLDDDGGAAQALESLAPAAEEAASWTGHLAQRYTGAIDRARLLGHARTPGQRAEALFYDAMLKRAAGDASAEEDLRAVLATEVLRYWEYEMSWEMLAASPPASPPASR
jgi:Tfp pilus assembly protein PilF